MFDTIIYIPTILAYTFISLLVVILCFIVIYVSHKVYQSVYDILPSSVDDPKALYKPKLPPALRIYIWIGRSRLAEMVMQPKESPRTHLLKYTDSISAIPWNDEHICCRNCEENICTMVGESVRRDRSSSHHCGEYVT